MLLKEKICRKVHKKLEIRKAASMILNIQYTRQNYRDICHRSQTLYVTRLSASRAKDTYVAQLRTRRCKTANFRNWIRHKHRRWLC